MTTTTASNDNDQTKNGWFDLEIDLAGLLASVLILAGRFGWWLIWFHPVAAITIPVVVAGSGTLGLQLGPMVVVYTWAALGLALAAWAQLHPDSYYSTAGRWLRSGWRREWVYRRRWRTAMLLSGLGTKLEGADQLPRLGRVRSERFADTVAVRLVLGQEPPDWERRLDRLAQAFRAKECRCVNIKPGWVVLRLLVNDPLEAVVPALPVIPAGQVDLTAVPVGITENGDPWCLRILGSHNLIGGRPGSGKSGLIWAMLHSLGDAIHQGIVQVWAVDPKGGMELADGEPMFTRYAYPSLSEGDEITPESALPMIELLEDAARLVLRRADQLRGSARKIHTPTKAAPAVIVIVDELLSLTTLLPDSPQLQLKRRATMAMGIIGSQGRAPAVSGLFGLQDVRKEAVVWRDLIDERTAFGMAEASQADLVLGPGARDQGARCELIPARLPGVGYIRPDREIIRVRAAWHDDDDNRRLAATYPAPTGDVIDVTARDGAIYTLDGAEAGEAVA